ncbi:hypothetical protein O3G_MSEX014137 [Manduca sexta]|uniref:Uncharacterized protein n=1 Tax=Manduca sexta TaxID=7130 RepID=A0A921ZUK0_MANSE|nr:hypothetical protein O3G_MSEX014137 [Manduca sexta]
MFGDDDNDPFKDFDRKFKKQWEENEKAEALSDDVTPRECNVIISCLCCVSDCWFSSISCARVSTVSDNGSLGGLLWLETLYLFEFRAGEARAQRDERGGAGAGGAGGAGGGGAVLLPLLPPAQPRQGARASDAAGRRGAVPAATVHRSSGDVPGAGRGRAVCGGGALPRARAVPREPARRVAVPRAARRAAPDAVPRAAPRAAPRAVRRAERATRRR